MKFSITLILLLCGSMALFAQNTNYLIHFSDSGSYGPAGIIAFNDGTLIIAGTELICGVDSIQKSGVLIKVDEQGNELERKFLSFDSTSIHISNVFKITEDSILVFALSKPYHDNTTDPDSILIMTFDKNLNLKGRSTFALSGVNEFWRENVLLVENKAFISLTENKNGFYFLSLHKIDLQSNLINSEYFYSDSMLFVWDMKYKLSDSSIMLIYSKSHKLFDTSPAPFGYGTYISFFDENLNYTGVLDTTLALSNGVSALLNQEDSNILFVYGVGESLEAGPLAPTEPFAKLYKLMLNDGSIKGVDVFYNEDTVCYTGLDNFVQLGIDLYCFGFFNAKPIQMPWQYSRSYLLLAKVDTGFQIQNIRLVGEDYFYMNYASCLTSDSNLVVAGTYFDYNSGEERYQLFLLKSDQNFSVGLNDQEKLWNNLNVYPNPASNNITLEIPDKITAGLVYIFNSEGSIVHSALLQNGQKNTEVSALASGNYFISFIAENGQTYSGQFVKE